MKTFNIVVLPGDGVGREVTAAAQHVLHAAEELFDIHLHFKEKLIGGAAIDATGEPLPQDTLKACEASDAVLLGAVGGPKWDGGKRRPEDGLLGLRKALGLFANLRPVKVTEATLAHSPLKSDIVRDVDLLIVRELTGGAYFGKKTRDAKSATDLCIYTVEEIERIARVAFRAARERHNHVTLVDKANVMETSRLWREVVTRIHAQEFASVNFDTLLVDTAAMRLIQKPRTIDVLLTENMFGDILSDEGAVLAGSIGMLPSASIGPKKPSGAWTGLYEPVHGSAPDIAGQNKANPFGAIGSVAAMLEYSFGLLEEAKAVNRAMEGVLNSGRVTADLRPSGTPATTEQAGEAVCQAI